VKIWIANFLEERDEAEIDGSERTGRVVRIEIELGLQQCGMLNSLFVWSDGTWEWGLIFSSEACQYDRFYRTIGKLLEIKDFKERLPQVPPPSATFLSGMKGLLIFSKRLKGKRLFFSTSLTNNIDLPTLDLDRFSAGSIQMWWLSKMTTNRLAKRKDSRINKSLLRAAENGETCFRTIEVQSQIRWREQYSWMRKNFKKGWLCLWFTVFEC